MTKKSIFPIAFVFILIFMCDSVVQAQKVAINTNPASAKIYVDGSFRGTGNYIVPVPSKECVTVEVKEDGYFTETRVYCKKRGVPAPPKTDYVQLRQDEESVSAIVTVTTTPQTAKIFVNGVLMGTGSLPVTIAHNDCVMVEVKEEGFVTETKTYCKKKGVSMPPKSDYFKLESDESFTSSVQSEIANKEGTYIVKAGRSKEEAWHTIVTTVLSFFDVLENNDEKLGYLRTNWIGKAYKANTVRMRLIVKLNAEEPLSYKIKFVSEASYRYGTAFSSDEAYFPYDRVLKKYDGFLEELATKLKN